MKTAEVAITFRMPARLRARFYRACARSGEVPSRMLRQLMADYASGRISYGPTTTPSHKEAQ